MVPTWQTQHSLGSSFFMVPSSAGNMVVPKPSFGSQFGQDREFLIMPSSGCFTLPYLPFQLFQHRKLKMHITGILKNESSGIIRTRTSDEVIMDLSFLSLSRIFCVLSALFSLSGQYICMAPYNK